MTTAERLALIHKYPDYNLDWQPGIGCLVPLVGGKCFFPLNVYKTKSKVMSKARMFRDMLPDCLIDSMLRDKFPSVHAYTTNNVLVGWEMTYHRKIEGVANEQVRGIFSHLTYGDQAYAMAVQALKKQFRE